MAQNDPKATESKKPNAGEGKPDSAGSDDAQTQGGEGTQNQYVTADKLRAAIDHINAEFKKAVEKAVGSNKQDIEQAIKQTVTSALAEAQPADKGKTPEKDVELSSLKRQLTDAQAKINELDSQLTSKKKHEKEMSIKQRIIDTLNKYDCINSERAYRSIKDDLSHDEDTDTIFITVKNEFGGDSRVGLDDYVKNEVRQNVIPQFFRGAGRAGSPAEGDQATGSRRYKFDYRVVKSKPEVMASEEFQKALSQGEVANMPTASNSMGVAS